MRPERLTALVLATTLAGPAAAWEEPARGTPLRAELLDAVRPHREWHLGAPVEIVEQALRVQGDRAWLSAHAQRPGGVPIDRAHPPMAARPDHDPHTTDGPTIPALLQRSGRMWMAVHQHLGATDSWWNEPDDCRAWRAVIRDFCP